MRKFLLMVVGVAVLVGCGKSGSALNPEAPPPAPTAEMIYADGWSKVEIWANYAHTNIDSGAHFQTDRNQCGYDAYGAIDIKTWNALAKDINTFLTSPRLPEEKCRELSDTEYRALKFDGTADLLTAGGSKVMLFETRSWSVCSLIQDQELHKRLLAAINAIVLAADKEDCSRPPWGII